MTAPTAAFLGAGAERAARRALRPHARGAVPLLLRWPSGRAGRGETTLSELPDDGVEAARTRGPRLRRGIQEIALSPDALADEVVQYVTGHAGAVAVVVDRPRDDAVDRVLLAVDEVVVLVEEPEGPYAQLVAAELRAVARSLVVVPAASRSLLARLSAADGQAIPLLMAAVAGLMAVAVALGLVASALGRGAGVQGRADVAALAGAAALRDAQRSLYDPDPARRLTVAQVRARAISAARATAAANEIAIGRIDFDGAKDLPTRVRVEAWTSGPRPQDPRRRVRAVAEVAVGAGLPSGPGAGEYPGPFATRQGQRMRPDVAQAFDRMQAAAQRAGHPLVIASAFRSYADQVRVFAQYGPGRAAPPGKSLHRLGTELDLWPESAHPWLAANATRFGFLKRYPTEPWHFGYTRSAGSASLGYRTVTHPGDEHGASAVPTFVPDRYAPLLAKAAQRWSVGAALLGAQLWQESRFNPRAVSPVGAAGIAQFMPATAAMYGLTPAERFDPAKAIDAQAHLMHDLLRQFGAVPLALAAYNAGPGRVRACGCVPAIPETQGYVQAILALLGGAGLGDPAGLELRLVA